MYDNADKAQQVANEVVRAGVNRDAIDVLQSNGNGGSSLVGKLTKRGVEEQEAAIYAAEIGKGSSIVAVEAPDETAEEACEIMNRFGARDLEQLLAKAGGSRQEQESVPVVEEQVSIGKRKVLRGGVRVTSTVSERPIEETVRLRDETIAVEKQRADRKLSPEEAEKAFQQKTVELTETDEEAVISKEARVVGEVSLEKTVAEHEETVQTTARRTDVKVEKIDPNEQRKQ
jgi:stress response protein YsnF